MVVITAFLNSKIPALRIRRPQADSNPAGRTKKIKKDMVM